jgi:hypothetical protein
MLTCGVSCKRTLAPHAAVTSFPRAGAEPVTFCAHAPHAATKFPRAGTQPVTFCVLAPSEYHRYISIGSRSLVGTHLSKAFIFSRLQKSAQLIENKHSQILCYQSIAHSLSLLSCKSSICQSYAKHTPGVWGGRHARQLFGPQFPKQNRSRRRSPCHE